MAEENETEDHPYRLPGTPPLPFTEQSESSDRGIPVYAVLDLGRPNEDPTVDRVFLDETAAHHHKQRIRGVPTRVIPSRLE